MAADDCICRTSLGPKRAACGACCLKSKFGTCSLGIRLLNYGSSFAQHKGEIDTSARYKFIRYWTKMCGYVLGMWPPQFKVHLTRSSLDAIEKKHFLIRCWNADFADNSKPSWMSPRVEAIPRFCRLSTTKEKFLPTQMNSGSF